MSKFDGVVACEVPREFRSALRQRVITADAVQWMAEQLIKNCPRKGRLRQSAGVIATAGSHVAAFFGYPYYYSHPVIRPEAAHYAAMVAESHGYRRFILTAKFDRDAPDGRVLFTGDETERIAEYCEWDGTHRIDSRLMQIWNDGNHELIDLTGLLPHPRGGWTKRMRTTPRQLQVVKQFDATFSYTSMLQGVVPKGFSVWCRKQLQTMLGNSRSDGETRPGRKAHAACIVSPKGECVFACNSPSDVGVVDCCSERAAARIALSAGIREFSVIAIASECYPKNGSLEMCDVCKATMCHHLYDGNSLVLYFESGKRAKRTWVSRVTRPYAFTDENLTFVEPTGSDGYF